MTDEYRTYTDAEKDAYVPDPCEHCGQNTIVPQFRRPPTLGDPHGTPTWVLGLGKKCTNPDCPSHNWEG